MSDFHTISEFSVINIFSLVSDLFTYMSQIIYFLVNDFST